MSTPLSLADSLFIIPPVAAGDSLLDSRLDTARLDALPRIFPLTADSVTAPLDVTPAWMQGLDPVERPLQPAHNSGFLMIIALLFVIMIFNFRHLRRLTVAYVDELVKVRRGRDNVFDERPAGDARVLFLLVIQAVVSGGILLATAVCRFVEPPVSLSIGRVAAVIAVLAAYYIALFVAYNWVGFTFASPEGHRDWVRGFNASRALLGISLAIPATLALFYPDMAAVVVSIGAAIYVIARLLVIFKGFRIFYTNILSLLYFILYLCTLEIIPLIFVYFSSCLLVQRTL